MTSLILDSQFGQYGYGAVGTALLDQVTVWPASTARTIVAAVQAEQVLETLDASDRSWDTAVGFGFGCGPAAALVVAGRAARALFIDPPSLLVPDPELTRSTLRDLPREPVGAAAEIQARLMPTMDPAGPYPDEFYVSYALQLTGDRALQEAYVRAWKAAEEPRQPYDLSLSTRPRDGERLDWLAAWLREDLDTAVWLPLGRGAYAEALAARGPDRPLVRTTWHQLEWLASPERVAEDLAKYLVA